MMHHDPPRALVAGLPCRCLFLRLIYLCVSRARGAFPIYKVKPGPQVLPVDLQSGCEARPDLQVFPHDIRIGMSASITGHHHSEEVEGMISALVFWHAMSRKDAWKAGEVSFCVIDDESNRTRSELIYKVFTGAAKPEEISVKVTPSDRDIDGIMDLMLGPSHHGFHDVASAAVSASVGKKRLLMLWSSPAALYALPNLPGKLPRLDSETDLGPSRRLSQTSEVPYEAAGGARLLQGTTAATTVKVPYVMNMNIDDDRSSHQGLKLIFDSGYDSSPSPSFALVSFTENGIDSCPVQGILKHAREMGFKSAEHIPFHTDNLHSVVWEMANVVYTITDLGKHHLDVLMLCSWHQSISYLFTMLRSANLFPSTIYSHVPGAIEKLRKTQEEYIVNMLLETRPFGFLADGVDSPLEFRKDRKMSYEDFVQDFRHDLLPPPGSATAVHDHNHTITMSTIQVMSCAAVLSSAMQELDFDKEVSTIAGYITTNAQSRVVSTLDGPKGFDANGRCSACTAGLHQVFPPPAGDANNRTYAWYRYNHSETLIATRKGESLTDIPPQWKGAFKEVQSVSPSWHSKLLDVYVCKKGCYMQGNCTACPRGKFRSENDMYCRSCPSGKYTDESALGWCKNCPEGADPAACSLEPWKTPAARVDWYLIDTRMNEVDPLESAKCSESEEWVERYRWVKCPEKKICLGNNKCAEGNVGILCANCIPGSSFMGFFPNLRSCGDCPSRAILYLRVFAAYVICFSILMGLSRMSANEAPRPRSIMVPLSVILLRHVQMLGVIQHSMAIDHTEGSFFKHMPGAISQIVMQPFVVCQMDCMSQATTNSTVPDQPPGEGDRLKSSVAMFTWGVTMLPAGYLIIIGSHLIARCLRRYKMRLRYSVPSGASKAEIASIVALRNDHYLNRRQGGYVFLRQFMAWSMLAVPVSAQACANLLACSKQPGSDLVIMNMNSDVRCDSKEFKSLSAQVVVVFFFSVIPPALVMIVALMGARRSGNHKRQSVRAKLGLLISGYRDTCLYYEVFMFIRTILLIGAPMFADGKQDVFIVQAIILMMWAIISRHKLPRLAHERHSLQTLERHSVGCLITTLILGFIFALPSMHQPLIPQSMVPQWLKDNKVLWVDLVALWNLAFYGHVIWSMAWSAIILPMQLLYKTYGSVAVSGCRWLLLYLINCSVGLNSVRLVSTGDEVYIDLSELKERERKILLENIPLLLQVCMDSKDKFNMKFIVHTLEEIIRRAGLARQAALTNIEQEMFFSKKDPRKQEMMERMKHLKELKNKRASESGRGGGDEGDYHFVAANTKEASMDELHSAFLDVEYDIMSRSPDLHSLNHGRVEPVGAGSSHSHAAQEQRAVKSSKLDEHDFGVAMNGSYGHEDGRGDERLEPEAVGDVDQLFEREAAAVTMQEQDRRYELKEKIATAQADLLRLREMMNKTLLAQARGKVVGGGGKSESGLQSGKAHVVSQNRPMIASDAQTLLADWRNQKDTDVGQPSTILSPRARGIAPTDSAIPVSSWEGVDETKKQKALTEGKRDAPQSSVVGGGSTWLADKLSSGFGWKATAERPAAVASLPQPFASTSDVQPIAHAGTRDVQPGADAAEDALDLYFDAQYAKVHHGVFKAMLLSGLRACGLPEAAIRSLTVQLRERDVGGGVVACVCGPRALVADVKRVDTSKLKVMGHPCREAKQASPPSRPLADAPLALANTAAQEQANTAAQAGKPPLPPPATSPKAPVSAAESEALTQAVSFARFPDASRRLEKLEEPRSILADIQIERIRRIEACYQKGIGAFQRGHGWQEDHMEAFNFQYACKVDDNMFYTFLSADFEGGDPVAAAVALTEMKHTASYNPDLVSSDLLVEHHAADSLWHVVTLWKELGAKEDNIIQVNFVDALDEDGDLIVYYSSPSDDSLTSLRGVQLPAPTSGMTRVGGSFSAFRISPLRNGANGEPWGFRLSSTTSTRPSRMAFNFLWMMPPWGLLRVYRNMISNFPSAFQEHLTKCAELKACMQRHDRVKFYAELRRRLTTFYPHAAEGPIPETGSPPPPALFPMVEPPPRIQAFL